MTVHSRSLPRLLARTVAASLLALFMGLANAQAQTRWVVDSKGSLAWWQMDPHMSHLWGTTCPQEPSWRPGEGRASGWSTEEAMNAKTLARGYSYGHKVADTANIPLYPRRRARFVCSEAIQGEIVLPDTLKFRGAHGQIAIKVKYVVTGENLRDVYQRDQILAATVHPDVKFTLDSIVDLTRGRGDTIRATAVGTWTLRGITKPISVRVRAHPEAGGIRVQGKFAMDVKQLTAEYGVYQRHLGLGVFMNIWKELWMGLDLLVRPDNSGSVQIGQ